MCPLRPAVVTLMNLVGSSADNDTQAIVFEICSKMTEVEIKYKLCKSILFRCTH